MVRMAFAGMLCSVTAAGCLCGWLPLETTLEMKHSWEESVQAEWLGFSSRRRMMALQLLGPFRLLRMYHCGLWPVLALACSSCSYDETGEGGHSTETPQVCIFMAGHKRKPDSGNPNVQVCK
jgi:hypothetical protein